MTELIWTSLGAFIISVVVQFFVIKLSHKYNLFIDSHEDKKPQGFHTNATPRAGGIGIFLSMILLFLTPLGWKLILSIILAFISGIFEDFYSSLNARSRLLMQFIAATSAVFLTNSVITYLGFDFHIPYALGMVFSIFAIVGMMNAVNMIDGFNGLAAFTTLFILFSFSLIALQVNNHEILFMCLIVMSSIIGFLIFNFPKGNIFLGDGGAYLLGFLVALIGIFLGANYELVSPWYVLSILIYPVWELFFSIIRKLAQGKSPFKPDSFHLHMLVHRRLTNNNPLTSMVIVSTLIPFMSLSTFLANNSGANFAIAITFIVCYCLSYFYLIKKDDLNL